MTKTIIPVILSGGTGSRLWPLSREAHPKPFITLPSGKSLLQETFNRACQFADAKEIITITNKEYFLKSTAAYESESTATTPQLSFLLEPFARNTAAAIALAALKVAATHGDDAIMLVLPADHLITPVADFVNDCQQAFLQAAAGKIVTFGIKPTAPETGYGYIEHDAVNDNAAASAVKRFVEKPDLKTAQEYLQAGNYLWNSGMFCFKAGTILKQLQLHAIDILNTANKCWEISAHKTHQNAVLLDETSFSRIPSTSIDYAVMEKSADITVIPCNLNWQDIGSWEAYKNLFASDERGNTILGDAVLIDSENNFIHSENRMVTSIGVNNLAIIDTPDAMLITSRDRVQDVKQIVHALKDKNHESYLHHRTVIRPWGTYTVLEEGPCFKIKRIVVKPGATLSLQKHKQRSEHWVVVDGTAKVIIGDKEFTLTTNESTFVPMQTPHRLSNPTSEPLIIIEVQTGSYLGEDDIERLDDVYGRSEMIV